MKGKGGEGNYRRGRSWRKVVAGNRGEEEGVVREGNDVGKGMM